MYGGVERNKSIKPLKAIEAKKVNRFIKVLKSFD